MWLSCPKCGEDCTIPIGILTNYLCLSPELMCFQCGQVSIVDSKYRWEMVFYAWRN